MQNIRPGWRRPYRFCSCLFVERYGSEVQFLGGASPYGGNNKNTNTMKTAKHEIALSAQETQLAETLDKLTESGLACANMTNNFTKTFTVARCVSQLKQALTPQVMQPIMELQGTPLGFRTDKDKNGGYPIETVKEVLIEATMAGLMPCGNQFNIIGGRMYPTKEGFTYLLSQLPDLSYTINQGVPVSKNGGAIVRTEILWRRDPSGVAQPNKKILEIPVRVNNGMGVDAILGKADRKAKCWLYNHVTGRTLNDGEVENDGMNMRPANSRVVNENPFAAQTPQEPQEAAYNPQGDNLPGLEPETPAEPAQRPYMD